MVKKAVDALEEVSSQHGAEQQSGVVKTQSDDQAMNWKRMREVYAQLKKEYDLLKQEHEELKKERALSKAPANSRAHETLIKLLDCGDVNVRLQAAIFLLK
jgi:hypothetical protein